MGLPSKEEDDEGTGSENAGGGSGDSGSRQHEVLVDMPSDCRDTSQQAADGLAGSMSGPAAASGVAAISTAGGEIGNGSQHGIRSPGSTGSAVTPLAGSGPPQQLQALREHDGSSEGT